MKKTVIFWSCIVLSGIAGADNLPGGSWMQSCDASSASFINNTLSANCKLSNGFFNKLATLDYGSCQPGTPVKNDNGKLACEQPKNNNSGGGNSSNVAFPGGDWVTTCKTSSASLNGTMLIAKCRNNDGQPVAAAIDLATCGANPSIHNDNGHLTCGGSYDGGSASSDGLPGGNWRQNCDVKGATMSMNVLRTKCKTWSGNYFPQFIFYDNCKTGSAVSSDKDSGNLSCDNK